MRNPKIGSPITGIREASYMLPGAQRSVRVGNIPQSMNRQQRRQAQKIIRSQRGR